MIGFLDISVYSAVLSLFDEAPVIGERTLE